MVGAAAAVKAKQLRQLLVWELLPGSCFVLPIHQEIGLRLFRQHQQDWSFAQEHRQEARATRPPPHRCHCGYPVPARAQLQVRLGPQG
jgi:hypothetical protein